MHNRSMKPLPLAGARLTKLRFCGNGKDSEVMLEIEGGRKSTIPLLYGLMDLQLSGPVPITTKSLDDLDVAMDILARPGQPITITEALVEPSCPGDEWDDYFRAYEETGVMPCLVALRLALVARQEG